MLRLPMHPRYSRMLVEAMKHRCVPAAALCAALVSGRDLLVRLGRDDQHIAQARELFEASDQSDFHTLMRAWQFARNNGFHPAQCRRYGVHSQIARQVEQTFEQILQAARVKPAAENDAPPPEGDALLRPPGSSTSFAAGATRGLWNARWPAAAQGRWRAKAWCKTPRCLSRPASAKSPAARGI